MSYQVLARKWRPRNFEDVVGQEHITRSLQNSLSEKTVGHAYIFSGTRGIGKTSVARIFAKALRCENRSAEQNPCGECGSCKDFDTASSMNVIEIDGASNNSVDNIRDLISNIQYLPSSGDYKIYIIDEVHMLSTSAFNALLKTLEEPPAHAVFILATTEPEKLLGTVLSRCQRFDFRNATVDDLVKHIKRICEVEGIVFENDTLISKLSKLGNGSFRDTLSLLDQVLSFSLDKKVTDDTFSMALGVAKTEVVKAIVDSIVSANIETLSHSYRDALSQNVSVQNIILNILEASFGIIMAKDIGSYQRVENYISEGNFNGLSRAEAYWIYEVLSQDFKWSLESLIPEDASEIVMRKVASRHDFIQNTQAPVIEKKSEAPVTTQIPGATAAGQPIEAQAQERDPEVEERIEQEVPAPEVVELVHHEPIKEEVLAAEKVDKPEEVTTVESNEPQIEEPVTNEPKVKDWEAFLASLFKKSPASASNLEQGNLLEPIQLNRTGLTVQLGFPVGAKVFYDYLNQPEAYEKLKMNLAEYFEFDTDNIHLNLILVEKEKAQEENFRSKAEIKAEKEQQEKDNKRDQLATDPLIKHAESIFNTKIDRIHLNED